MEKFGCQKMFMQVGTNICFVRGFVAENYI